MNSTHRIDPPNPEVHWHFISRYNHKIEFEGLIFEDIDFGYITQPIERKIPDEVIEKII
ncbi:MAG: hypothetical protein ACXVHS_06610 [Methanobacterium sp.]